MIDFSPLWCDTAHQGQRNNVCKLTVAISLYLAVSMPVVRPSPEPARISLVDFRPEPFRKRDSLKSLLAANSIGCMFHFVPSFPA